jgi:hypothetical protein
MYSMLREDYIISIIDDNGKMDENRLTAMVRMIANQGANALRDFFWIDSEESYQKISPFKMDGGVKWNDDYFSNQRRIAEICRDHGLKYYFSPFDHCGTKVEGAADWNPWRFVDEDDFFYADEDNVVTLRHQFIDRALEAFQGLNVGLEVCNEPKHGQGEFLTETFVYLVKNKKFEPRSIILGNDYHLKELGGQYGKDYRYFRDNVAERLGDEAWMKRIKTDCVSPFHGAHENRIEDLWGPDVKPGGDRRILYSMDGVRKPSRPNKSTMQHITEKVLSVKSKSREQHKVHFEVVFGKQAHDSLGSISGVSEGYKDIFGHYPENFGKFPGAVYPVPFSGAPVEKPEDDTKGSGPVVSTGPDTGGGTVAPSFQKQLDDLKNQLNVLTQLVQENKAEIAALKEQPRRRKREGVWTS